MEFPQSSYLQFYPSDNSSHTTISSTQEISQEETITKIQRKTFEELEAKNNEILEKRYFKYVYQNQIAKASALVTEHPHFQLRVLQGHLEEIERLFNRNRIYEAKEEVQRELKIFPKNIEFKRYFARILYKQSKIDKADRAFKEALNPNSEESINYSLLTEMDFRVEYAAFLEHQDRCEEAFDLLKDFLQEVIQVKLQKIEDVQNILILAKVCYRLGKYENLRKIVNMQFSEKSYLGSSFTLGNILFAIDKKEEVSAYLHGFLGNFEKKSKGASSSVYCMILGYLYLLKYQSEIAKSFFAWALKKDPHNMDFLTYYLKYFLSPVDLIGNLKEAKKLIQEALTSNEGNDYNLMRIILICREYVDEFAAIKLYNDFKKRLDDPRFFEFEGCWERSKGNLKKSSKLLVEAYALKPEDPSILRNYGETQRKLGNLEDAEKLIKQSLKLKEDIQARLFYALVLFDLHRFSEAKEQFEVIFWSMPFHEEALKGYEATLRAMDLHEQAHEQKIMIDLLCTIEK